MQKGYWKKKMEILIKDMQLDDLERIKESLKDEFDDFWTYNVFKSELENPLSKYIVATNEKNEIIGYAGIWQPDDEAHITNIVTKKIYRNKKIGTRMLEELLKIAKSKNIKDITLEVNANNKIAISLYKKYNFKEIGLRKKYYHNIDDALIMTLYL